MEGGRRAFLRGSFLTREGRARETRRRRPYGPPPPWHRHLPLDAVCPECAHPCVAACETDVIRLHPADHDLAGQPYLNFQVAGCTYCGACAGACPCTSEPAQDHTPAIGEARLDRAACLAWNDVICMACVGRCDARALVTDAGRHVRVEPARCTGCGLCVAACPTGALRIDWSAQAG